jgi:hypothetical protein
MAWGQRDPVLEQRWRERIAKWQASGLSVRAFCEQRGLTEASFYYWKRELQARDAAAAVVSAKSRHGNESRPTFIPLTVIPTATTSVEVRCPSGHVVCLPSCEVSVLTSLFAALNPPSSEEPSC